MTDTRLLILVQGLVTFGLLAFAYAMRATSPAVSDIVVSAAVYHWLRESASIGRSVSRQANGGVVPPA